MIVQKWIAYFDDDEELVVVRHGFKVTTKLYTMLPVEDKFGRRMKVALRHHTRLGRQVAEERLHDTAEEALDYLSGIKLEAAKAAHRRAAESYQHISRINGFDISSLEQGE